MCPVYEYNTDPRDMEDIEKTAIILYLYIYAK